MKSTGTQSALEGTGGNRTGVQTSPELARELIEGATGAIPSSEGGPEQIAEYRSVYIEEGFPVGSLPTLPASEEGKASEELVGAAVLLDKLSERLAFERMGTRLYDALISKVEAMGEGSSGPTLAELQQIRDEELTHFLLLKKAITELGGDPTVMSPCADVTEVASQGIPKVLTDPRTSVTQSLQAILTAELTDNAGWELLIELVDSQGYEDLVAAFQSALEHEEVHLANVREWLSDQVLEQAQA